MKKNLIGAIVIFFVTLALLLVIDDFSNSKNPEQKDSAKVLETGHRPKMATNDQD